MEILKQVREKINKQMLAINNIDKLMTDKVDDYILIEEQPIPIQVGKYTIFFGNLTIKNQSKMLDKWIRILGLINVKNVNMDLLGDGAQLYEHISTNKKVFKELCKMMRNTICKQQGYYRDIMGNKEHIKWRNIPLRYLLNNLTIEKLIQMCFMVYIYNYDSEKKNLKILLRRVMGDSQEAREHMETYMYFWLQNLAGLTGKFQLAQSLDPELLLSGSLKTVHDMSIGSRNDNTKEEQKTEGEATPLSLKDINNE